MTIVLEEWRLTTNTDEPEIENLTTNKGGKANCKAYKKGIRITK